MQRRFASGKNSGSEYDLSLATFALKAGWTWQETVDLLIAFRRKHDLKPKTVNDNDPFSPLREQYYTDVLMKCDPELMKQKNHDALKQRKIDEINMTDKLAEQLDVLYELPKGQQISALTNKAAEMLGIPLRRIMSYDRDDPQFWIETDTRQIMLGSSENLTEQRLFRKHLGKAYITLPSFSKDRWFVISTALMKATVREKVGEDATNDGLIKHWVRTYLHMKTPLYDRHEAYANDRPFFMGRLFCISSTSLRNYLRDFEREVVPQKELPLMLQKYGFDLDNTIGFKIGINKDNPTGGMTKLAIYTISVEDDLIKPFVDFEMLEASQK